MDRQKTRLSGIVVAILIATTIPESLYVLYKESSIKNPNFLKARSISSKSCFVSASTK